MSYYSYTPDHYFVSSLLSESKKKEESKEDCVEVTKVESFLELGNLYSIELRNNEIKKKLSEFFEFEDDNAMLDYLASNNDVFLALPQLARFILTRLNSVNKLSVYLLNENKTWKTLFINIYSNASWEETDSISGELFNILFESRPSVFEKVNFNFCQL